MLELKDFFHLPQVDELIDQLVHDGPGLTLVAGMDSRPANLVPTGLLSGGASTFFGVLARRLVAEQSGKTILVSQRQDAIRLPATLRSRVQLLQVKLPLTNANLVAEAADRHPELIIVDQVTPDIAGLVFRIAQQGQRILSRVDCIFSGSGVARHLAELGVPRSTFDGLRWIVTVQRLPTLCPECKTAVTEGDRIATLLRRYPGLTSDVAFFRSTGCAKCNQTGRRGDVVAFDVLRAASNDSTLIFDQPSQLSLEEYALRLAALGHVSVDDVDQISVEQTHHTFMLFTASERALADANTELKSKVVELETARQVLERRTESLIALEEVARSLIASTELDELAQRICRATKKLCGADRSILYVLSPDGNAKVVAANGWGDRVTHTLVAAADVRGGANISLEANSEPTPFRGFPPGIPARHEDVEGAVLRAGLRVPLVAQGALTGVMIVQSTWKVHFTPGDNTLLQTLASQAATAIQRADLVRALRDKVVQLEAAQAELIKKERLERELELAREVQQSLLPRVFPEFPGYVFAARSEAARRVGGDFYDVFRVDDGHFGIVIADVSDKGMPAALFMALTKSLLFAEARRDLSPRNVLTNVHRLVLELGEPDMFVTVFYGVVDLGARTLTYGRAGHEQPLLLRGRTVEPLRAKGTLVGSLDASQFLIFEERVPLEPGDRLVLYTDGLVDATNSDEVAFGRERFQAMLEDNRNAAPDELCRQVFDRLTDYRGKADQFDDMALVVMDVR